MDIVNNMETRQLGLGPPNRSAAFWRGCGARWTVFCLLNSLLLFAADSFARPNAEPAAEETPSCVTWMQAGDELWVLSTRHLGCPRRCSDFQPAVRQYLADGWQERTLDDLAQSEPLTTVVYVHGNRFTHTHAIQKGFRLYGVLARGAERPPMRFVIWSWPSEQISGPFRDVRLKAERADIEGFYLACFMAELTEVTPWSFLGHSFGARVIGGALEALGSGKLRGVELATERAPQLALVRVALLAAAIDGDIFLPGRDFGNALEVVEQLLVFYNPLDPILKRYALLDRFRRPRALGAVGMPNVVGPRGVPAEIRQRNVARAVGRSHDDERFFASPALMSEVRRVLLGYSIVDSLATPSPEPSP